MFDRLRRAVALVLGNRSLLGQVTCFFILSSFCHLFKFFIFFVLLGFCFSLSSFLVRLWCVDNALIKGEIEECGVLTPGCDE